MKQRVHKSQRTPAGAAIAHRGGAGTPEQVAKVRGSYTGRFLKGALAKPERELRASLE